MHRVGGFALPIESAILALEICNAEQLHRFVDQALSESSDERGGRCGDRGNWPDAAWKLFNIDTGKRWADRHGLLLHTRLAIRLRPDDLLL